VRCSMYLATCSSCFHCPGKSHQTFRSGSWCRGDLRVERSLAVSKDEMQVSEGKSGVQTHRMRSAQRRRL